MEYKYIYDPGSKKKFKLNSPEGKIILFKLLQSSLEKNKIKNKANTKSDSVKISKIVGVNSHPFVLFYFKNVSNIKSILLIGEEHNFSKYSCGLKETHCFNMNSLRKYIFNYIENMGCKLDVFIENYTKNKRNLNKKDIDESFIKSENSMLRSWENRFILKDAVNFCKLLDSSIQGECIQKYSNVFFHLTDLRYMFDSKLNLFVALNLLEINLDEQISWFNYNRSNLESIIHYMIFKHDTTPSKKKFKKGKELLSKLGIVFDKIKNQNKTMLINTYDFNEFIENYRELIQLIIHKFGNSNTFLQDFIKANVNVALQFGNTFLLNTLDALLMDLFTVNKMFSINRSNIMFYGGGWHTILYCEFIRIHFKRKPNVQSKNKIFDELKLDKFKYQCGI